VINYNIEIAKETAKDNTEDKPTRRSGKWYRWRCLPTTVWQINVEKLDYAQLEKRYNQLREEKLPCSARRPRS